MATMEVCGHWHGTFINIIVLLCVEVCGHCNDTFIDIFVLFRQVWRYVGAGLTFINILVLLWWCGCMSPLV